MAEVIALSGCEAVRRGVMAGLGVGLASRHSLVLDLAQGLLSVSPMAELTVQRSLCMLERKDRRHTAAALAVLGKAMV